MTRTATLETDFDTPPAWSPDQVARFIAERDDARAALDAVVRHCYPHGASPDLLRRSDPVWQQVAKVLWG
jgi:hypothetical protein